jgi:hypothetical protein
MSFVPTGYMPSGYFPEGFLPGQGGDGSTSPIYVPPHRTVRISSSRIGPKTLRWAASKLPGEPARFRLDFTEEVEVRWVRRIYSVGERISVGGYDAHCLQAGLPGWKEPRWPMRLGAIVVDGSVVWEMSAPSSASLVQVAEIEWRASDITVNDKLDGPLSTSAVLIGGEPGAIVPVLISVRYGNGEGFDQPCQLLIDG